MKKIFTLIGVALMAMSVNAQDKYVATVVTPSQEDPTKDVITLADEFTKVIDTDGKATNVVDGKSVVNIATENVTVEAVGGAVPATLEGSAQDITPGEAIPDWKSQDGVANENVFQVKSVNSWGDIKWENKQNKTDINDEAGTKLYFVLGTGNPFIEMFAEQIITDGQPTGKYRAIYNYYRPGMDMPQVGLYYKFTTKKAGKMKVQIWANKGNRNTYLINGKTKEAVKYAATGYINGQKVKDDDGNTIKNDAGQEMMRLFTAEEIQARHDAKHVTDGVDAKPYVIDEGGQAFWGWITFDAEADGEYWLFQDSSQIGFGGYEFTAAGGGESGIATIAAEQKNAPIFNLAGQRVGKNVKGLMIQNGKKFLVK